MRSVVYDGRCMAVKLGSDCENARKSSGGPDLARALGHSPGRYGRASGPRHESSRDQGLAVDARLRYLWVRAGRSFTPTGVRGTNGYHETR